MKEEILSHLHNPHQLEKMYRDNKLHFKKAFSVLYPELKGNVLADCWHERLNFESDDIQWGSIKELVTVILAALVAGTIAKLPEIFSINEEYFYPRHIGFIVFPLLAVYFSWKNNLPSGKILFWAGAMLAGLVFINLLPNDPGSDTLVLSCIHLVLFLWSLLGFAYVGTFSNQVEKRLDYLRYNGDLVVMTALILIAGAILSGITIGLFSLIGFNIEQMYMEYVGVFGLAAAPIVGTYLTQTNPQLVGKVSPVIAKIFSPLVLIMLVIYLVTMAFSGKDPYNDREFLIIFNALLIGVMALIFFSVAETTKEADSRLQPWVLFLLSVVTVIVNGIALSAIVFRIAEWGITPNRAAVLGGNVLILLNLLLVTVALFKVIARKADISGVGRAIAVFLPLYFVWTVIVTFIFPFLFG